MRLYEAFSDVDLLELFKHGDQKAYEEIYRRYWSLLYISACKILKDEDEAKDVVQEVFISFLDKGARLQISVSLSVYLYSSIRYKVLDKIKHKKVSENYLLSLYNYSEAGESVADEKLIEKELIFQMERAILLLPEKMRIVFELSRNQQLSHKEIAKMLDISDKTVKKQINNALKILKIKLSDAIMLFL
ncbi:RNA polymerase sigma-70 factor [Pedobacter sp. MC2016-14]|uniref:RNA polymerase sigma factor n=1 Tax=Pedobacter sp. MC2016-14 TaxID=2897327 RepID=UPI001E306631|nr:RNA polymerase sigma-70 factor [Pedobacter sp. MC2016-14]MCD0490669.1 RNA polymerase sigma-70 factor [Pedobacter sp. MC2016-14]